MKMENMVPGMKHTPVEFDDGIVCGVLILYCKKTHKLYIGYRSNLYSGVNSIMSALRNKRHKNLELQASYDKNSLSVFTFPTDTVGEALDLKNSIIDEFAQKNIFFNIYAQAHISRIQTQLRKYNGRKSTPVKICKESFATRKQAALAYGLSESTVSYRIKSPNYPEWKEA